MERYRPSVPILIWILIGINFAVFLMVLVNESLFYSLGLQPSIFWERPWTIVTNLFVHAGIYHILFNMIALRQIAPLVIREFGPHRMVILYLLTGIIGFLVSYLAGVELTIGASAAVCGLIGASIYYGKSRGGIYGQIIYHQIGAWALGIFIFGLLVPSINNWGHGGGMVAGAMLGFVLGYEEKRREHLLHRILAGLCVVATLLILLWAIGSGIYFRFLA